MLSVLSRLLHTLRARAPVNVATMASVPPRTTNFFSSLETWKASWQFWHTSVMVQRAEIAVESAVQVRWRGGGATGRKGFGKRWLLGRGRWSATHPQRIVSTQISLLHHVVLYPRSMFAAQRQKHSRTGSQIPVGARSMLSLANLSVGRSITAISI